MNGLMNLMSAFKNPEAVTEEQTVEVSIHNIKVNLLKANDAVVAYLNSNISDLTIKNHYEINIIRKYLESIGDNLYNVIEVEKIRRARMSEDVQNIKKLILTTLPLQNMTEYDTLQVVDYLYKADNHFTWIPESILCDAIEEIRLDSSTI